MKHLHTVPVVVVAATLGACGSLDANIDHAPALAEIKGTVVNPDSLPVNGSVRVAVVWRTTSPGRFNVAEDLPVQPVFPSAFTIQLDGPPPADVMISLAASASSPPPSSSTSAGGGPAGDAQAGGGGGPVDEAGLAMQSLRTLDVPGASSTGQYAIGTVVAYIDRNGNGKLDLAAPDAGAYIDQVVATNIETSIFYFQGPIPGLAHQNPHNAAVEGYNLLDEPPCNLMPAAPSNVMNMFGWPPNAACASTADAGAQPEAGTPVGPCAQASWLPISTPLVLTVATAPEISQVACENGGPSTQPGASGAAGGAGPFDPSVQPAQYPDPCDPNLLCASDGSNYFYLTCTTVNEGLCLPSYTDCTSVGYARPTPAPAAWPCIH
jgi:hypothetical protein